MKKLLIIMLIAGVFTSEYAWSQGHRFGGVYARPSTTLIVGGGFYSPFYPAYGYYGYPYYSPSVAARPSKLDQEIADINHDYDQRIESVRMNDAITGKDRRQQIRELKATRDNEIEQAKKDYYKQG